jgi:type IV secretion system protein VirD4
MFSIKIRTVVGLVSMLILATAIALPVRSAIQLTAERQQDSVAETLERELSHGNPIQRYVHNELRSLDSTWKFALAIAVSPQQTQIWLARFEELEPSPRPLVYRLAGIFGLFGLLIAFKAKSAAISIHYGARWATRRELKKNFLRKLSHQDFEVGLLLASWPKSALFFGTFPGQLKRLETMHTAVIAATRSGKTLMLITNLIRWRGSAVVIDPKGELRNLTGRIRQKAGQRIVTLDPRGYGDTIDIIAAVGDTEDGISGLVELLLDVKKQSNPAFSLRAVPGGVAAIQAALALRRSPWRFIRDHIRDPRVFAQAIHDSGDAQAQHNLALFMAGDWSVKANHERLLADRFFASSWATFTSEMRTVLTDGVCKMFGGSSFKPEDLLKQKLTAYLMFDDKAGSSKSLSMLLYAINRNIKSLADANPNIKNRARVLFVLEELGSVPMPGLPEEITTASGRGMTFLYVIHDLPQLEGLYGTRGAKTILNNTGAKVFYGTSDPTTAQYVEAVMGYTSVSDVRISKGARGKQANDSESTGQYKRELMPAHEMFTLEPDEVVVEYRPHKIRAKRVNWMEIPAMKNLHKIQPLEPAKPIVVTRVKPTETAEPEKLTGNQGQDDAAKTYVDLDES